MGPKPKLHLFTQELAENELNRPLEISNCHSLINVETFNLVEGRIMGRIGTITPIDTSGNHNSNRRFRLFHRANLH